MSEVNNENKGWFGRLLAWLKGHGPETATQDYVEKVTEMVTQVTLIGYPPDDTFVKVDGFPHPPKLRQPLDHISPNFLWLETVCRDGTYPPPELYANVDKVVGLAEAVRLYFGNKPMNVTSWYRSAAHNERLKKEAIAAGRSGNVAKNSQHLYGLAVDFNITGVPLKEVQDELENIYGGKGPKLAKYRNDPVCVGQAAVIYKEMRGLGRGAHRGFVHIDCRPGKRSLFNYK